MIGIRFKHRPRTVPLLLAALAVLILALAIPSLMARLIMLPGDAAREALLQGAAVSDEALQNFLRTRRAALQWRATNDIYDDLAMATLAEAKRNGLPRDEVRAALDWQQQALALSPADPYGWARLAFLYLLTEGPSDNAAHALAHSIEAGPHEPRLLISRVSTAIMLGDRLDPGLRRQLPAMLREAWADDPLALIHAAHEGRYTDQAEAALADEPEEVAKFRRMAE
jgi:hypothetical protein